MDLLAMKAIHLWWQEFNGMPQGAFYEFRGWPLFYFATVM